MLPRLMVYMYNDVGITCKASEEITRENTENCRFRQPHALSFDGVDACSL